MKFKWDMLYNIYANAEYVLRHRKTSNSLQLPAYLISLSLVSSVLDASDFLGVPQDVVFEMAENWPNIEGVLFRESKDIDSFYRSWSGSNARHNICANILNQHLDTTAFRTIGHYFGRLDPAGGGMIDYGCGTAALTLALCMAGVLRGRVELLDVPNETNEFVRFRIKRHGLSDRVAIHDVTSYVCGEPVPGMYCVDVLEHLEEASAVFKQGIHPMLRIGGLLYLRAPWRGQLTHLDAAADNFYTAGGRTFLRRNYRVVHRAGGLDINCVYRKMRS